METNQEQGEGKRSKRIRPQTEKKASPTGKSPPAKKSATSQTKSASKAPGSKKGSKKGANNAASKVGAKSCARKLSYSPDSNEGWKHWRDCSVIIIISPFCLSANGMPNCRFVNDQPEKGGARTQDEVLKDLAELSKISSAAKAGLLGADAVLRLDNETQPGPTLNGEDHDEPALPGSLVSTRAQALRKSNLTFIIKPTTQYYYKFAPSASPEEQRDKMKALVIAYTVHDGPDEAGVEVAYFAWLPEGQYWSNLGLDLVLDFVVTKQVPPEVVFLIG
eukprot:g28466.t1